MKKYFVSILFLFALNGLSQKAPETKSFSKAKLAEVKLLSELSSEVPKDMTKASTEIICKVSGSIKTCHTRGDSLSAEVRSILKKTDNHSKIYFDVNSGGAKPRAYTFAILVVD